MPVKIACEKRLCYLAYWSKQIYIKPDVVKDVTLLIFTSTQYNANHFALSIPTEATAFQLFRGWSQILEAATFISMNA